ncbi:HI1506-related protein [Pectobacterium aroidearum]|uniref:HI1506-related protein n=1 Tax=Pectobacterium aroidearum TaxID=1201031 RepID=UPI0032EF5D98
MPIQITSRSDGFRRCGMAHSAKTQTYPDDHFTTAELETLEREPQLIVVRVSGDAVADVDAEAVLAEARVYIATLEANALKHVEQITSLNERLDALSGECHALKESNAALTSERDALQAQLAAADAAKQAAKK